MGERVYSWARYDSRAFLALGLHLLVEPATDEAPQRDRPDRHRRTRRNLDTCVVVRHWRNAVPIIARLKERRDKIQAQLDRWISRGFKGGGEGASGDATQKETAAKVSEVADLNRAIADHEATKRDT